jgi:GNAT superfamily N-acetyltransferase
VTELLIGARVATPADADRLDELVSMAGSLIRPGRGGAQHLDIDGFGWTLAERMTADATIVLVGTIDSVVLGFAVVSYRELAARVRVGRIEALFVEPDARELGVGEALLDALLEWCQSHQCRTVDAVALPGDRHTKNFFETFGLVARALTVSRSLDSSRAVDRGA